MRILLAVETQSKVSSLDTALRTESYVVDVTSSGEEALQLAKGISYDLVILGLKLSRMHGFDVLRTLRAQDKVVPVLILTSLQDLNYRLKAFDLGADDCLIEPFEIRELQARARALIQRVKRLQTPVLKVNDLELYRESRIVHRGGRKIILTNKEFLLLEYLMFNSGKVLTRRMIGEYAWGWSLVDGLRCNVVDVYVNYLRKKVDYGFPTKLIHTVYGQGYRIADCENTSSTRTPDS